MSAGFFFLLISRITDSVGPTETSIAPRQRPKAANNVLPLATVTPVKMTVPSAPVSNGQKGLLKRGIYLLAKHEWLQTKFQPSRPDFGELHGTVQHVVKDM